MGVGRCRDGHDKKPEWIWGTRELEAADLIVIADKGYQGAAHAKVPYQGKNKPESQKRPIAAGRNSAQPFIAYSATQATVMVSMVPLGCAESWFCDCRVRFMGMVGHWAGELSELRETLAQTRPSIV